MKKTFLTVIVFVLAMFSLVQAQDLTTTLTKMAGDAAQGYVQPVASGFGANLNGGWFHKSPQTKIFGIDLELGLVAMGTFTTDENKTFSANGAFRFGGGPVIGANATGKSQAQSIAERMTVSGVSFYNLPNNERQAIVDAISNTNFQVGIAGPTVVGTKQDTMKINIPSTLFSYTSPTTNQTVNTTIPGTSVRLDGVVGVLDGAAIIPLAAPQASIGTIYGTQFTFRYLPDVEISKEIGKFKYFGFGIQHNLGMWLPIPVVDVSASFFTQNLKVGTIFESKATTFGLNASKQFGFGFINVTPYAGFMLESSTMNVTYNFEVDNGVNGKQIIPVAFELTGENKSRLTIGLGIRLLVVNINVDYNLGKQNSATAGLFFAF